MVLLFVQYFLLLFTLTEVKGVLVELALSSPPIELSKVKNS